MRVKSFVFFGVFLVSSLALGAPVTYQILNYFEGHDAHKALVHHSFLNSVRERTTPWEQIAQFFRDRVYILEILEKSLDESDFEHLRRSSLYQKELYHLVGTRFPFTPSPIAVVYGDHLKTLLQNAARIHLWTILYRDLLDAPDFVGLLNGSDYYLQYGNMNFSEAKSFLNTWLEQKMQMMPEQTRLTNGQTYVGSAYAFIEALFNELNRIPEEGICNQSAAYISAQCYRWTGF